MADDTEHGSGVNGAEIIPVHGHGRLRPFPKGDLRQSWRQRRRLFRGARAVPPSYPPGGAQDGQAAGLGR